MFFQSVSDPIAHDYSQVQNCMHTQLQQQFTHCELNQPIVSTISCSLLIWKGLGRWLPLQLASCGQLCLLVQSCTLKHGRCKSAACSGTLYIGPQTSNLMCTHQSLSLRDHQSLLPGSVWRRQPRGERRCSDGAQISWNATRAEETNLSIFWQRREREEMLTWVGTGKGVYRVRKTYILIIWDQEGSIQNFTSSEWGPFCLIRMTCVEESLESENWLEWRNWNVV